MKTTIKENNIKFFKEFLSDLIPKLQKEVKEGGIIWKSKLRDFTPPCLIEIFYSNYHSLMFIFPQVVQLRENCIIHTHALPNDEKRAVVYIQDWVNDALWRDIPYPIRLRDPSHPNPTFQHALAGLTPLLIDLLEFSTPEPISESEELKIGEIVGGSVLFLDSVPELNHDLWMQVLAKKKTSDKQINEQVEWRFFQEPFGSRGLYAIPSLISPNVRYGCYFSPCVWLGEDFWLDIKAHIYAPEFRDIKRSTSQENQFVGKSMFQGYPVFFDRKGMLILGSQLTKDEALVILNKLMFSLKTLVDKKEFEPISWREICPVSDDDICEVLLTPNPSSDSCYPLVRIILPKGTGNREFWLENSMKERGTLDRKDEKILIVKPQKIAHLIKLGSEAFSKINSRFYLPDELFDLFIRTINQINERHYLSGFILMFFTLERIINNIWKSYIGKKFVFKGISKQKLKNQIFKNKDWTLSLVTNVLILADVISNDEGIILDFLRKLRNNIAHEEVPSDLTFDRMKIESFLDLTSV